MYGQEKYGNQQYAYVKTQGSKKDEYYVDLTKLVPEFMVNKREMKELYLSQGYEIGYLHHILEDVTDQCFPTTATWGLTRWESIFGIKTNFSLTYEQRREILMAKMRGHGTTTIEMIKEAAAAFSGGEVEVIEDNPSSLFIVRFIGIKGIPRNMQGFIQMLEDLKPAHLSYRFEYRYTTWNYLTNKCWNEMSRMTWDFVRTLKED